MHKIDIPESIIEACVRRRGRLHVHDQLDPGTTALVVIDMQNSWLVEGLSVLEIPAARAIVSNINSLASSLRRAGGTVAWTQSTFPKDWSRTMYRGFASSTWIENVIAETRPGSDGFAIYPGMDRQPEDLTVHKSRPSAFIQGSSRLEELLRQSACDTLIITGTLTNACCESSARDAAALGFRVIFVSDATATRSDIEHNATLINLVQLVADVRTTSEVLGLIQA